MLMYCSRQAMSVLRNLPVQVCMARNCPERVFWSSFVFTLTVCCTEKKPWWDAIFMNDSVVSRGGAGST